MTGFHYNKGRYMERIQQAALRLRGYFPLRIIWGYIGDDGEPCVFASKTKRAMLKETRAGRKVYILEYNKGGI